MIVFSGTGALLNRQFSCRTVGALGTNFARGTGMKAGTLKNRFTGGGTSAQDGIPWGYWAGEAWDPPRVIGAMRGSIEASGAFDSIGASARAASSVTMDGSGALSGNITSGYAATVDMEGAGSLSTSAVAQALASVAINIGSQPSAEDIAYAVWGLLASASNTAGTMGEKMNSAGGAADPWDDSRALTVAKFLGLK